MEKHNNNSGEEQKKEVIDLQAVADDNTKRMGEAIEAAFLAKVCQLRIPVCKPWGDSERYDFVVDWGKGFWRVQVKGGSSHDGSSYRVRAGCSGKVFTKEDMDFVVVHIVPEDVWYVVPIEIAEGLSTLWFQSPVDAGKMPSADNPTNTRPPGRGDGGIFRCGAGVRE
jgi:PD-(D/E)XK endonuclease